MKKRILAILLAFAAAVMCTAPAFAADKPRVSGVDYKRIYKPGDSAYNADVIIGNQTFFGHLERELALSEEETDEILRATLRELGMTEGTLMAYNNAIEKAKKIKDFDLEKAISMLCALAGVDNFIDLFGYATGWGDKSAKDIALDYAVGEGADFVVTGAAEAAGGRLAAAAGTSLGGLAISVLVNAGKISIQQYEEWNKNIDVLEDAINAHQQLNMFYARANKNIADEDEKRGGEWRVHIDETYTDYNVTFFGVEGNTQTWHVWGTLKRQNDSHSKTYDPTGIYKGEFNIEITHDLTPFDTHFFDEVVKRSPFFTDFVDLTERIAPMLASEAGLSYSPPFYSYTNQPGGASELAKLYHADELTVEIKLIPYIYQQNKVNFYLSDMYDDSTFNVPHTLQARPEANIWSSGGISASNFAASMELLFSYRGGFKEPTVPALYPEQLLTNLAASSFGQSASSSEASDLTPGASETGWRLIVGEDSEILRSLRGRTCFLISGGN